MSRESFEPPQEKEIQEQGAVAQEQDTNTPWGRLGLTEEEFNKLYDDTDDPDAWLYQRK